MEFEEKAEELAADGWTFRKKRRKGNYYISARKGNKERGLGKFSEERWSIIKKILEIDSSIPLDASTEGIVKEVLSPKDDPFTITVFHLRRMIAFSKFLCQHRESDGFCNYWLLHELPISADNLRESEHHYLFKKLLQDGSEDVWLARAFPGICAECPAFKAMKDASRFLFEPYSKLNV